MPIYSPNRNIVTVIDVWRECNVGITGCPVVKDLKRNYGTTWKKSGLESKYFRRRNELSKRKYKRRVYPAM
ncbi:hypothetical protein K501DRAFT_189014 [Backusella circina FSU 941]|nr:hypothetical protein K501DRAFT_189014 [Backusella circina FSU 941]